MQPSHPFTVGLDQWAVVAFLLFMTFLSGVLGGYLFGLTRALRHDEGGQGSKSLWTHEDEN
jgi:hypothetical protein